MAVGMVLLTLLVVEGVARAGFAILDARKSRRSSEAFRSLVHPGEDWADVFHQELEERRFQWQPYVHWRRVPAHGGFINVDERGLRRTWNTAPAPGPDHVRLFMFGSSTMWGTGTRDDVTIPSLVSKTLHRTEARAVWVTNYGQTGYVSTQDLLTLMLELRQGRVPHLAVFYGGFNDAIAAWQSGVAGIPENEAHRVREFNLRRRLNVAGFAEGLAIFRLSQSIIRGRRTQRESDPALAEAVVDAYLSNVRVVDALARHFGFSAVFFWQPSIYTKEPRSAWEARAGRVFDNAFFTAVNHAMRRRLQRDRPGNVYDLSDVFDGESATVFVDVVHTREEGANKIVERIVAVLRDAYLVKQK